jgi:hypothetical protein
MAKDYSFTSKVWMYDGPAAWHFVTLPPKMAEEIETIFKGIQKSFGSIRVEAAIGKNSWNTSIFKDTKSNSYVLPLKAEIRKKAKIKAGDLVPVIIKIS